MLAAIPLHTIEEPEFTLWSHPTTVSCPHFTDEHTEAQGYKIGSMQQSQKEANEAEVLI